MNHIANVEAWSGKNRGDENFPVGSHLIRPDLRPHVHAFYNFARNADDIADSPDLAPEDKLARLDVMEDVLLGRREDGSPSALVLRDSLAKTRVKPIHATELLIAFRLDATKRRYATLSELYEYCRYSAAPVGRHVLDLHREPHTTHAPSDALCSALQILNHMQDCAKDLATLDRCYLPEDLLAEFGTSIADLRRPGTTPGLRKVFELAAASRGTHDDLRLRPAAAHAGPAAAAGDRGDRRVGQAARQPAGKAGPAGTAGEVEQVRLRHQRSGRVAPHLTVGHPVSPARELCPSVSPVSPAREFRPSGPSVSSAL